MRHAADVILVGAATVRIENYSGAQLSVAQRQARQRRGQAEVPPVAVVTQSGDLDHDAKLFTRTEVRPLILTCTHTMADARGRLGSVAEVIDASGPGPTASTGRRSLKILADRRLFRVLTEGGPQFLSLLIEDRPARRTVPDGSARTRRRRGAANRDRARPGAHPDAAHSPAHRRRGLPVHPLRQGRLTSRSLLWSACVGIVSWSGP